MIFQVSPIMLIDFHAFPSVALLLLLLSLIFHHKRRRNFAYSTQGRDLRARPFAIAFQIVTWPSLEKNPMPRPRERAERHAVARLPRPLPVEGNVSIAYTSPAFILTG